MLISSRKNREEEEENFTKPNQQKAVKMKVSVTESNAYTALYNSINKYFN